jgi:hypothetical protein
MYKLHTMSNYKNEMYAERKNNKTIMIGHVKTTHEAKLQNCNVCGKGK